MSNKLGCLEFPDKLFFFLEDEDGFSNPDTLGFLLGWKYCDLTSGSGDFTVGWGDFTLGSGSLTVSNASFLNESFEFMWPLAQQIWIFVSFDT